MIYQQYIRLDVHKQFVFATKLDAAGQVVKQWRFATTPKALRSFAASLTQDDAVCLESTTNAVAIYRLIPGTLPDQIVELGDEGHLLMRVHGKDPYEQVRQCIAAGLGTADYKLEQIC